MTDGRIDNDLGGDHDRLVRPVEAAVSETLDIFSGADFVLQEINVVRMAQGLYTVRITEYAQGGREDFFTWSAGHVYRS